jgi:predicted AlkP superfamily phosphohydrolase/phosphomutase
MAFKLIFTEEADKNLLTIKNDNSKHKRLKAIHKSLGYLEVNPKHPSLNTHEYTSLTRQFGIKIFEAYAENKTPQAYRIFWHYGPDQSEITIIAITPHP